MHNSQFPQNTKHTLYAQQSVSPEHQTHFMHNSQFPLKSRGFLMIKEKEAKALEMWHDAYITYLVCF